MLVLFSCFTIVGRLKFHSLNCSNIFQVYFQMLDALLAEEKIPDEYSGQTQVYRSPSLIILAKCYKIYPLMDCERDCSLYSVMTVRRKELLVSIGYIANAHTVAHTTPGFYDSC